MDSLFITKVLGRLRRLVIGPRRTPAERRWSVAGLVLGAALGSSLGAIYLGVGMATNPSWQAFPPPLAPFVLLPLPAGALAGLRFTTELTRPDRLTLGRIVAVSAGVLFLTVSLVTTFGVADTEISALWPDGVELLRSLLEAIVIVPILSVVWSVFPGLALLPFLVPATAAFGWVMRRLSNWHRRPLTA